jgi:hypothetical protein
MWVFTVASLITNCGAPVTPGQAGRLELRVDIDPAGDEPRL